MNQLPTESINPKSRDIDLKSIPEILSVINEEDRIPQQAVKAALPEIARAVEAVEKSLRGRGRLIYYGAGTSGRIGVVDAAECAPTYGIPADRVFAVIAGGYGAMVKAAETAEDGFDDGVRSIIADQVGADDVIIGLSASGSTPFVTGALQEARRRGAVTVGIVNNAAGTVIEAAEIRIVLLTGPEVITGSTRMKAATAQKMTVNMISTCAMIRLGRVTGNFMTAMRASNVKLRKRAEFIVSSVCCVPEDDAATVLKKNHYDIRESISELRERKKEKES